MSNNNISYILFRLFTRLLGLCLIGFSLILTLSLFSFDINDPSFNTVSTSEKINNYFGYLNYDKKNYEIAESFYKKAIELNPEYTNPYNRTAVIKNIFFIFNKNFTPILE